MAAFLRDQISSIMFTNLKDQLDFVHSTMAFLPQNSKPTNFDFRVFDIVLNSPAIRQESTVHITKFSLLAVKILVLIFFIFLFFSSLYADSDTSTNG